MPDQLEQLRVAARLELPPEVELLVSTLTADELARLEWLWRSWPAERGEVPRARVRACLDWPGGGR